METQFVKIPLDKLIKSPYQGRFLVEINDPKKSIYMRRRLRELADSIVISGLLQPILVRKKDDQYEIIDGHRRVEAFKKLGYDEIPAQIVDRTDKETQVMTVVSNLQRIGLNHLEKALAFEKILNAGVFKSKKELSKKIGKDETYVGDIMNILKMDKRIIDDIAINNTTNDVRVLRLIRNVGKLDEKGYSDEQYNLYRQFIEKKLNREQLQELVMAAKKGNDKTYQVSYGVRGFTVKVHKKLSKEQKDRVKELLEQKMQEVLKEMKLM